MAAITAAEQGVRQVLVLEGTPEPLQKVRISGGGRCNVTHACWDPRELATHYPRGSRPLRGPFSRFACGDAIAWFDEHGLTLVEESDGRMFPQQNRSEVVIQCLQRPWVPAPHWRICPLARGSLLRPWRASFSRWSGSAVSCVSLVISGVPADVDGSPEHSWRGADGLATGTAAARRSRR